MTEPTLRRPTIKDVAERAKVSLKTVSRVINNEPSVMQGTRTRVLHAIDELDYEPDQSARNLRSGAGSSKARDAGLRFCLRFLRDPCGQFSE